MVDRVVLEQVYLPVIQFSPVSRIPPMPHIHLNFCTILYLNENERSLGTLTERDGRLNVRELLTEKFFHIFCSMCRAPSFKFFTSIKQNIRNNGNKCVETEIQGHYFMWQLFLSASCRLVYYINIARPLRTPTRAARKRRLLTNDSCHVK